MPQIKEHPEKLWNVIWNCSFGLLFYAYFHNAENKIRRELMRFRFYIAFAIMQVGYVIIFSIFPTEGTPRLAYVITFVLCEIIILLGIRYAWKDYQREKYLDTKCKGKHATPDCTLEIPCLMCTEYRDYMTNDQIGVAIRHYHERERRRSERKKFFNNLKPKKG